MEQKLPILLCKSNSTHTQHLTLQQYFSHPRLVIYWLTSGYPWRSDTIHPCLQARIATFGSQDLGFRTSINGHLVSLSGPGFQNLDIWLSRPEFQDLDIWLSRPGFQDLDRRTDIGHRKLSILRSSYLFPVTFLCIQWSQTHGRTDRQATLYIRLFSKSNPYTWNWDCKKVKTL
jgi:hypothetical protein